MCIKYLNTIFALIILLMSVSCAKVEKQPMKTAKSSETAVHINKQGQKVTDYGAILYDNPANVYELFDKITLNGRPVKLGVPFSEMGDFSDCHIGLPLRWMDKENPHRLYSVQLYLNTAKYLYDDNVGILYIQDYETYGLDKSPVVSIYDCRHGDDKNHWRLNVDGIGIGSTVKEMMNTLGNPTLLSKSDRGDIYVYARSIDEFETVQIFFTVIHGEESEEDIDHVSVDYFF